MFDYVIKLIADHFLQGAAVLAGTLVTVAGLYLWRRAHTVVEERTAPASPGTRFTVLVAQLESDTDGSQTRHVVESLENHLNHSGTDGAPLAHVLRYPKALKLNRAEASGAVEKAEGKGQTWLERKNADVLVWGSVSAADQALRLRFLPREHTGADASSPPKRYKLGEVLELPQNFHADLGAVIAASAAVSIQPVFDGGGSALCGLIEPVVNRLAPLAANMPDTFASESKAALWNVYAAGEQQLGEERGENARLEKAVAYYRKALGERMREKAPLDWAAVQNNLGNALHILGERESAPARINEAVTAYREALKEQTRERTPLDWARTQNNLGAALFHLGECENGTERMKEAVAALRASLEERTREQLPLDWARTQNNLGIALFRLGERERGTTRLEEAVTALRAALEEYPRDRVPLDWAAGQNNLGNALRILGERGNNASTLEEAADAYRAALAEYTRDRLPLDWARAQINLGEVLLELGERESSVVLLEEAVSAYRAALEEFPRERVPLDWAKAQNNLGEALCALGEGENGTALLEEAITAFRASLEEYNRERVPLDWAKAQNNLGAALTALGQRQAEDDLAAACATLKDARTAYLAALGEFVHTGASQREDNTRRNIGQLSRLMARLGC